MVTCRITRPRPQDRPHDEAVALGCPASPVQVSVDISATTDAQQHSAADQLMDLPGGEVKVRGVVVREHAALSSKSGPESVVHRASVAVLALADSAKRTTGDGRPAPNTLWIRESLGERRLRTSVAGNIR